MKKYLLTLLVALIGCVSAMAGNNPLRLKSGSVASLKGQGGTIYVDIDYSGARANRKPFEQYLVEDYQHLTPEQFDSHKPDIKKWFTDRWDDDIEEGPRHTEDKNAPMTLKIVVKGLQLGSKSFAGASSLSGMAYFYRSGEEEPFATVEILKMMGTQGGYGMSGLPGVYQVFNDCAEYLCDLIYHN